MSCKSAMYSANTATQNVAIGGVVNFGQIVRRYGNNLGISGGNATLSGTGYYDLDVNLTFSSATAGATTFQVYKDGVAIPGALATVTMAADDNYSITIPAIIRQMCCCQSIVTIVVSGAAVEVTNAAIAIEKI